MKNAISRILALSVVATVGVAGVSRASDITAGPWTTDRYEPASFIVAPPTVTIGISPSQDAASRPGAFTDPFYNTQGRQQGVSIATPWTVSADLFVSTNFNTTTGELMRTDLWTRDSAPIEANANYPILGITNASPTDPFNASATDRSVRFRAWDSATGWVELGLPGGFTFGVLHNLSITSTGSAFDFRIDGALVYHDTTYSDPGSEALQTVFLEAYNFGPSGASTGTYSVQWSNVQAAPVPLPASVGVGFAMLAGFGIMFAARKKLGVKPRIA